MRRMDAHSLAQRLSIVACAAALFAIAGCSSNHKGGAAGGSGGAPNQIVIGEYGSLSGDQATFGTSTDKGVDMALAEVNSAGGVNGVQLKKIVYDDTGQADQARDVVTRLIEEDKVGSIIGEVASSNSLAAAPVCQRAKVPMVTPASTNIAVTKVGDYIFRTCYIDPFQGAVMAMFATKNLHLRRAAVFSDSTSAYSKGLAQAFTDTFTKLGGQVVVNTTYSKGASDYSAQLASIKQANPDMIYVPGYYTEVGTIARNARQLGLTVPLMGGDGWDSAKLFAGAGSALEGCYFSNHYSVQSTSPLVKKFVAAYEAKNGGEIPDAMAALAYDATHILIAAYQTAGKSADGDYDSDDYRAKLRDAIAATKDYAGVTGEITIGPDRNAVKSAVVLQIHGTQYKYITTVAPS